MQNKSKKRENKKPAPEPTRRSSRVAEKPKVDYKEKNVKIIQLGYDSPSESSSLSESEDADKILEILDQPPAEDQVKQKKVPKPRKKKDPVLRKRKFIKGKWNPDIVLARYDMYKNQPNHELINDDSVRMTNLNAIRAVFTNDLALMSKVFYDKKHISTLNATISPDVNLTALDFLAMRNQTKMLEMIIAPEISIELHETYDTLRQNIYTQRTEISPEFMDKVDTGMCSERTFGFKVAAVQMSRGNKQGNNAFIQDVISKESNIHNYVKGNQFIENLLASPLTTKDTLLAIHRNVPGFNKLLYPKISFAIQNGNLEIAAIIIEAQLRSNGALEVEKNPTLKLLRDPASLTDEELLKNGITLPIGDFRFYEVAALDPTGETLRRIIVLFKNRQIQEKRQEPLLDLNQRTYGMTVYHFAAVCKTSLNLKILVEEEFKFMSVQDLGSQLTPLELAIKHDNACNVRLIVEMAKDFHLERKFIGRSKITPIGVACKEGSLESLKVLIELGASQTRKIGFEKLTPLCYAAMYDHFECAEYLCDRKGRVNGKDKFDRTPLILAARNGHTRMASLLLQRGALWDQPDSSLNTALHYAAGFGWLDCVQLLIAAGANINAENSWKITPVNLAMMKNRRTCVKKLLEQGAIKVNCTDENGRSLLQLVMIHVDERTQEIVEKILSLGADANLQDFEKKTALHCLAQFYINNKKKVDSDGNKPQIFEMVGRIAKLLVDAGADVAMKNEQEETAFAIALGSDQIPFLESLAPKLSFKRNPELLQNFVGEKLLSVNYIELIISILNNEPDKYASEINRPDREGFTHLIRFVQSFVLQYQQKKEQKKGNEVPVAEFLKLLDAMVSKGADPTKTVGKLRKEEISSEETKKKEELQKYRKEYAWDFDQLSTDEDELTPVQLKARRRAKRRAAKVLRAQDKEYSTQGLKNIWHFLVAVPAQYLDPILYGIAIKYKVNAQQKDTNGDTPLIIQARQQLVQKIEDFNKQEQLLQCRKQRQDLFESLIQGGAQFESPDREGMTPYLTLIKNEDHHSAQIFVKKGANINHKSESGWNVLIPFITHLDLAKLKAFVEECDRNSTAPLDINLTDSVGRNLLHHAMNTSADSINVSFDFQRYLIEKGIAVNSKDHHKRTPLHYTFYKFNRKQQGDPIEVLSNILAVQGLLVDEPDEYLKTPLHYASECGAITSSLFLIQRGARVDNKNIFGNTPLGTCLQNSHWNLAIFLLQNKCDMNQPVFLEDVARQQRIWAREQRMQINHSDSESDAYLESDLKPIAQRSIFKIAIQNQQNSLAYLTLNEYDCTKAIRDVLETKKFLVIPKIIEKIPANVKLNFLDDQGQTLMHIFVNNYRGSDINTNSQLYDLVFLLKSRGVDVYGKDKFNRSVLWYSSDNIQLVKFFTANFKFDVNEKDTQGVSPFYSYFRTKMTSNFWYDELVQFYITKLADLKAKYRIKGFKETKAEDQPFVNELITETGKEEDAYECPLTFFYILRSGNEHQSRQAIDYLIKQGCSLQASEGFVDGKGRDIFQVAILRNDRKNFDLLLDVANSLNAELKSKSQPELKGHLEHRDFEGKSATHHLVNPLHIGSFENDELLKKLHQNKFKLNLPDNQDKFPADYAKLQKTQKLYKSFVKFKAVGGESAAEITMSQMTELEKDRIAEFESAFGQNELKDQESQMQIDTVAIPETDVVPTPERVFKVPFKSHAEAYLKEGQQKQFVSNEEKQKHERNPAWYLGPQYEVVKVEGLSFSVFLTKANIENFKGQYLFYKMQLLHDTNRDLYMVYTRWGQIGEDGMNQRTPFDTIELGKKEFNKIFTEKTSNKFGEEFTRADKKYNLTRLKEIDFNYKELLTNFDWAKSPKSNVDPKIQKLVKSFAHPGYFRDNMTNASVNQDLLPISKIDESSIAEARILLGKISESILKDNQLSKDGLGGGNYAEKLKAMEEIYTLSNRYYEFMPTSAVTHVLGQCKPITSQPQIEEEYKKLKDLSEIGIISKIFFGALSQQEKVNPVDYLLQVFDTQFDLINKSSQEFAMINRYIAKTWQNKGGFFVANVFSVNKEGQQEAISQYRDLTKQKLLFHGSSIQNFVGIFTEGMQVVHSQNRGTGLLGNGLYFADRFDKAISYSGNLAMNDPSCKKASQIVLICEVALGKQLQINSHQQIQHLAAGYSSIKMRGKNEPDPCATVVLEDTGLEIPQGDVVDVIRKYAPDLSYYVHNQHSEYVVLRPEQVRIRYIVQVKKTITY